MIDLKIKLVVIALSSFLLFGLHKVQVQKAVSKASAEIHTQYKEREQEIRLQSMQESKILQDKITSLEKDKRNAIKTADASAKSLRDWMYSLPSTPIRENPTRDSSDRKDTAREVIGGLHRSDANDLIEYAYDTEQLKIHLISCYKEYDSVKKVLDDFRTGESKE